MLNRRAVIQAIAATAATATTTRFAAAAPAKVKIGYLHTLAVDGQMWIAESQNLWEKNGLDPEFILFQTGLELFQAMSGGSIDVLTTGAVMSNFPARGQGKVFLINDIEFATAQLWVHPDMGIDSWSDLKGKSIATTAGTTAHVFLDTALRAHEVDPVKDIRIVNQRMPDAVTAFIAKAVPAVALWVPFNIPVMKESPDAKMLGDASEYYPQAAIVGGWAARNDFYEKNKNILEAIIKAWSPANDYMIANPDDALIELQEKRYPDVPLEQLQTQYKAQKMFTSEQWAEYYKDGTVTKWLQQVTDFFVDFAKINDSVPASTYFDPQIYLNIIKA